MSLATEGERLQTASNCLKCLLEQQEDPDDEFYGGFHDEEDNDYRSEESEDVVDSDFGRPPSATSSIRTQKKEQEQAGELKLTRQQQKKATAPKIGIYQQIEFKKKEIQRIKLIQEYPRICTSSMTILSELNDSWNDILDERY